MLRSINSVRLVALLVYALAVHAVVWSVGAAHASGAGQNGLAWCGKSALPTPSPLPLPSDMVGEDAACQLTCGTAVALVPQQTATFDRAALESRCVSLVRAPHAQWRASAQPRGPPALATTAAIHSA